MPRYLDRYVPRPLVSYRPSYRQMAGSLASIVAAGYMSQVPDQLYRGGQSIARLTERSLLNKFTSGKSRSSYYKSGNMGGVVSRGRRYGYRKRKYRKRRYKKKVNKGTKKYIKKVAQSVVDGQATGSWRNIDSGQISCEENQYGNFAYAFLDTSMIEQAIDGMKVINVSGGNATATNIDPLTQNGLRTRIVNARQEYEFRNNGRTPCYLEVYKLFVRKRMSESENPITVYEDGLEDRLITSNEQTDLRFNTYDSPAFKRFFKIMSKKTYLLNPADNLTVVLNRRKPFVYDPDVLDQYTANDSQPRFTQWMFIRIRGVVAHDDTTTSSVGTCDATVDFVRKDHIKFSSVMGQGFKYHITGGGALDTMAAGSVVNIPSTDETGEVL